MVKCATLIGRSMWNDSTRETKWTTPRKVLAGSYFRSSRIAVVAADDKLVEELRRMSQSPVNAERREVKEDVEEALSQYLLAVSCYWRDYWTSAIDIYHILIYLRELLITRKKVYEWKSNYSPNEWWSWSWLILQSRALRRNKFDNLCTQDVKHICLHIINFLYRCLIFIDSVL